jgi:hypothetical protein
MSGSLNYPKDGRSSGYEAVASTLRQTSFLRVMVALAATVVMFVGTRLGANPQPYLLRAGPVVIVQPDLLLAQA